MDLLKGLIIVPRKGKVGFIHIVLISICLAVCGFADPLYSQDPSKDATLHPYRVNYWVSGSIIMVGVPAAVIGGPGVSNKSAVTNADLRALDRNVINPIDRWALDLDPSKMGYYANLSDNVLGGFILLPALTMLDRGVRSDWLDVVMMYAETQAIVVNIYLYSPLGPTFQNRLRPVVYYDALGNSPVRTTAWNWSSFYSGHVADVAAASFFTAKVLCDYHPELGWKKYLVYGAATIPPLIEGYLRMRALDHFPSDIFVGLGVGALCGLIIPEIHRIRIENVSLGLYSSAEGTGVSVQWHPDFGK